LDLVKRLAGGPGKRNVKQRSKKTMCWCKRGDSRIQGGWGGEDQLE